MTETVHHPYEMHEGSTSVLSRIGHYVGYTAHLGMGLARAAVEGFPELFDPEISILRRHPDEQPSPPTQAHFN